MTKGLYIGLLALGLSACASQAPLDDAYYWKERSQESGVRSQESGVRSQENNPSSPSNPSSPKMEIVSQQDTTITVRIKR